MSSQKAKHIIYEDLSDNNVFILILRPTEVDTWLI